MSRFIVDRICFDWATKPEHIRRLIAPESQIGGFHIR
jgi:hypothetical protein